MTKFIIITFSLLLSFSIHSKLRVVTTTTNLMDVVRQVGGSFVDVQSLCKGTQDPHYLEAKPSYIFKVAKADLLIDIGLSLEQGWLPLIVRGSRNPNLRVGKKGRLVASSFVRLLDIHHKDDKLTRADGDVHPDGNPHFMLDPENAILVARGVSQRLIELDKENTKYYQKRFQLFEKKMKTSLEKWKNNFEQNIKVVTYHKTLSYFYHRFNINNVGMIEPKPGIPPTAAHIISLISKMKELKVKYLMIENIFDPSAAKKIKQQIPYLKVHKQTPIAVNGLPQIKNIFDLYDHLVSFFKGN